MLRRMLLSSMLLVAIASVGLAAAPNASPPDAWGKCLLVDSPLVNTISRGVAPIRSAIFLLATSTALAASQPKLWFRLAALPNFGPRNGKSAMCS